MMKSIKVIKIGNSVGIILPSSLGLKNGDTIRAEKKGNLFILDTTPTAKEHDRKLIEDSFKDFESHLTVTEEEMKKTFGKYGWN
ncbi:AbrB family transcriptional regulator [Enterococcus villorum]|nr:AbrB family transcriptional regulator [Enterococcus villorum]